VCTFICIPWPPLTIIFVVFGKVKHFVSDVVSGDVKHAAQDMKEILDKVEAHGHERDASAGSDTVAAQTPFLENPEEVPGAVLKSVIHSSNVDGTCT
jgi:hypothetical protein